MPITLEQAKGLTKGQVLVADDKAMLMAIIASARTMIKG